MFSEKVVNSLSKSSFIRAMFEEGERLRKLYGPEKVYDFSIGNPDIEPPKVVKDIYKSIITSDAPGIHRYMNNAGYPDVRQKVADKIKKDTGVDMPGKNIIMTCGAAGGLNVVMKSLLNPGEEVIVLAPYFVEYHFYIDNHGGKTVIVKTDPKTFEPDVEVLESHITPKTKVIIINSPNNPTGVIYSEKTLKSLASMLENKEKEYGTSIYVISDEPYAKVVYDGAVVPDILKIFKNSIIINSFSKSLSLPGERIGYIAANPAIDNVDTLIDAMIFSNRILGYVNAPAVIQKVAADSLDAAVDTDEYKRRRDKLYNHLIALGFTCIKPQGAFYLFPKALIDDDVEFAKRATKHNLLIVPGTGFAFPGYFRIAYSVDPKIIENSLPAFEALAKEFK